MAIKKITLTEDHLKLIENMNFEKFNFDDKEKIEELKGYALDLDLVPNEKPDQESNNDYLLKQIKSFNTPSRYGWGLDQWNLFGGTYVLEDVALILGKFEEALPDTVENASGRRFPAELEDYMWGLYSYLCDNMDYIMSLVLQYSSKGGLTPGTYKCIDRIKKWEKVE